MKRMPFRSSRQAFSLVEIAMALGIATFCLIAIFSLLPSGINVNRNGSQETLASSLATAIATDLRATPRGLNSPTYNLTFPPPGESATTALLLNDAGTIRSAAQASFRATITITTPASGLSASTAHIRITWPGNADPDLNQAPSKFTGSFETVVGLDRN